MFIDKTIDCLEIRINVNDLKPEYSNIIRSTLGLTDDENPILGIAKIKNTEAFKKGKFITNESLIQDFDHSDDECEECEFKTFCLSEDDDDEEEEESNLKPDAIRLGVWCVDEKYQAMDELVRATGVDITEYIKYLEIKGIPYYIEVMGEYAGVYESLHTFKE